MIFTYLGTYLSFFKNLQSHLQSTKDKLAQRQCAPTGRPYGRSNAEEVSETKAQYVQQRMISAARLTFSRIFPRFVSQIPFWSSC